MTRRSLSLVVTLAACTAVPPPDEPKPVVDTVALPTSKVATKRIAIMGCGAATCTEELPVCCLEMPSGDSSDPGTFCAPSWRDCQREGREALYSACGGTDDCGSERCCHVIGEGQRCQPSCSSAAEVICQTTDECPRRDEDGHPVVACQQEVGAYVYDDYGFCRYRIADPIDEGEGEDDDFLDDDGE